MANYLTNYDDRPPHNQNRLFVVHPRAPRLVVIVVSWRASDWEVIRGNIGAINCLTTSYIVIKLDAEELQQNRRVLRARAINDPCFRMT